jgi:hypothetical protein
VWVVHHRPAGRSIQLGSRQILLLPRCTAALLALQCSSVRASVAFDDAQRKRIIGTGRPAGSESAHAASHQQRVGGIRRHSAGRCCGLGEHHPPPLLRCHLKPLLLTSIVYWEQAYIPRVDEPAC